MPKTNGHLTKQKILDVSKDLFFEKGFDGTGIEEIRKTASVNKGSIYYHFKDKNDILNHLFKEMMSQFMDHKRRQMSKNADIEDIVSTSIDFMNEESSIFGIMLMEALKKNNSADEFYRIIKTMMLSEIESVMTDKEIEEITENDLKKYFVHEFFTGIMPSIAFATLKDSFGEFFSIDEQTLTTTFKEMHMNAHIKSHVFNK